MKLDLLLLCLAALLAGAQAAPNQGPKNRRMLGLGLGAGYGGTASEAAPAPPPPTPYCTGDIKKECCSQPISFNKKGEVISPLNCTTKTASLALATPTVPLTWTDGVSFTCKCPVNPVDALAIASWAQITPPLSSLIPGIPSTTTTDGGAGESPSDTTDTGAVDSSGTLASLTAGAGGGIGGILSSLRG